MPNTYSQIYIQLVFAVKYRKALIHPDWEKRLYEYITGIIRNREQKLLAINGMPDHIHILVGVKPNCQLSDLVRDVKRSSNLFIKQNKLCPHAFEWQEGFGAFSYSHREFRKIAAYIDNQKAHHQAQKFKEEYLEILRKREVEYNEDYLFNWLV
jgi:REP element-mobilizing transposase RayT